MLFSPRNFPFLIIFFFIFSTNSLQRCSTMLGGEMPVTTFSLYLLQSSLSPALLSSPSGKHTHIHIHRFETVILTAAVYHCLSCFTLLNPRRLSCRIIYCTWVYPVTIYKPFFGYYFFNGLLMTLQCLHIFWAILIIRIAIRFLTNNVSKPKEIN